MRKYDLLFLTVLIFLPIVKVTATTPTLLIFPKAVIPGEPVKIVVENVSDIASIRKIIFDGIPVGVFNYQGKPTALLGTSLNKKPGQYKVSVKLSDGRLLENSIIVGKREKIEAPLEEEETARLFRVEKGYQVIRLSG